MTDENRAITVGRLRRFIELQECVRLAIAEGMVHGAPDDGERLRRVRERRGVAPPTQLDGQVCGALASEYKRTVGDPPEDLEGIVRVSIEFAQRKLAELGEPFGVR